MRRLQKWITPVNVRFLDPNSEFCAYWMLITGLPGKLHLHFDRKHFTGTRSNANFTF